MENHVSNLRLSVWQGLTQTYTFISTYAFTKYVYELLYVKYNQKPQLTLRAYYLIRDVLTDQVKLDLCSESIREFCRTILQNYKTFQYSSHIYTFEQLNRKYPSFGGHMISCSTVNVEGIMKYFENFHIDKIFNEHPSRPIYTPFRIKYFNIVPKYLVFNIKVIKSQFIALKVSFTLKYIEQFFKLSQYDFIYSNNKIIFVSDQYTIDILNSICKIFLVTGFPGQHIYGQFWFILYNYYLTGKYIREIYWYLLQNFYTKNTISALLKIINYNVDIQIFLSPFTMQQIWNFLLFPFLAGLGIESSKFYTALHSYLTINSHYYLSVSIVKKYNLLSVLNSNSIVIDEYYQFTSKQAHYLYTLKNYEITLNMLGDNILTCQSNKISVTSFKINPKKCPLTTCNRYSTVMNLQEYIFDVPCMVEDEIYDNLEKTKFLFHTIENIFNFNITTLSLNNPKLFVSGNPICDYSQKAINSNLNFFKRIYIYNKILERYEDEISYDYFVTHYFYTLNLTQIPDEFKKIDEFYLVSPIRHLHELDTGMN